MYDSCCRNKIPTHKKIDYALEQSVIESYRGIVLLNLFWCRSQDLMRDIVVVIPIGNSDCNIIKFSIQVNGKLPLKSKTVTFNFQRRNLTKIGEIAKRKLEKQNSQIPKGWFKNIY